MQGRNTDNLEVENDQKQITLFDMGSCWQHRYEIHAFCNTFPMLAIGAKKTWSYHESRGRSFSESLVRTCEKTRRHTTNNSSINYSPLSNTKNSNSNS